MKSRRSREQTAAIAASRSAILDMEVDCSLLADGEPATENFACMYALARALLWAVSATGDAAGVARKARTLEALATVCEHGLRSGGAWRREYMDVVVPGMDAALFLRMRVRNDLFSQLLTRGLSDARAIAAPFVVRPAA